jgi:hypothetical protein
LVDDEEVCEAEVVLLDQHTCQAAAGEVARDAGAVDAAADDEHVACAAARRGGAGGRSPAQARIGSL